MSRYVLNTPVTVSTKKAIKKFGEVPIKDDKLDGSFEIVGYRQYSKKEEIDVVFKGKIKARIGSTAQWLDSSVLITQSNAISKVKLNRFIRKAGFFNIKFKLNYFGVRILHYSHIKKITWQ